MKCELCKVEGTNLCVPCENVGWKLAGVNVEGVK